MIAHLWYQHMRNLRNRRRERLEAGQTIDIFYSDHAEREKLKRHWDRTAAHWNMALDYHYIDEQHVIIAIKAGSPYPPVPE
jgi:hypothetical protein